MRTNAHAIGTLLAAASLASCGLEPLANYEFSPCVAGALARVERAGMYEVMTGEALGTYVTIECQDAADEALGESATNEDRLRWGQNMVTIYDFQRDNLRAEIGAAILLAIRNTESPVTEEWLQAQLPGYGRAAAANGWTLAEFLSDPDTRALMLWLRVADAVGRAETADRHAPTDESQ